MGDFLAVPMTDDGNRRFVEQQSKAQGFADEASYVLSLIELERKHAEKAQAVTKLRALIQESLDSGPAEPFPPGYFEDRKQKLLERMKNG